MLTATFVQSLSGRVPLAVAGSLALFFAGCQGKTRDGTVYLGETVLPPAGQAGAPVDLTNDFARLLAGLPGGRGAPLNGFRQGADFKMHEGRMALLWKTHEEMRGREVQAWSAAQLGGIESGGTVFYPFGGPDYLFADAYFPSARRYVLAGLESIDPLPDAAAMNPRDLARALDGLSASLQNVLEYGYFQTRDMRAGFAQAQLRGVLPVLLVFLARTGHVMESVTPVGLSPSGAVVARAGGHPCPGVLIRCRSRTGGRQEVYYFQEDLSDGNLGSDPRILHFARSAGRPVTYLKSASYLLHGRGFERLRHFILTESRAVVQDPSGVPFRYFRGAEWEIELYGFYHGPLEIFSEYFEPDLLAAYEGGAYPVSPMGFGAGYRVHPRESSLMVARRR